MAFMNTASQVADLVIREEARRRCEIVHRALLEAGYDYPDPPMEEPIHSRHAIGRAKALPPRPPLYIKPDVGRSICAAILRSARDRLKHTRSFCDWVDRLLKTRK
jgi:hypothetical protein